MNETQSHQHLSLAHHLCIYNSDAMYHGMPMYKQSGTFKHDPAEKRLVRPEKKDRLQDPEMGVLREPSSQFASQYCAACVKRVRDVQQRISMSS